MFQYEIAYLFRKPPAVHDIKKRRRICRRCVYGYYKRISQPFSFISLLVSTVNALVNEKIWSFKSAFHRWCAQYSKINLQSGVDLSKLLPFQVGLYSSRLLRTLKRTCARQERKMQKKEDALKRTRRLTIVDWAFVERRVIMQIIFLWICFKRTQNEIYS